MWSSTPVPLEEPITTGAAVAAVCLLGGRHGQVLPAQLHLSSQPSSGRKVLGMTADASKHDRARYTQHPWHTRCLLQSKGGACMTRAASHAPCISRHCRLTACPTAAAQGLEDSPLPPFCGVRARTPGGWARPQVQDAVT